MTDYTPMPFNTPIKVMYSNSAKVTSLLLLELMFKLLHLFKIVKPTFSQQAILHSENNLLMEPSHLRVSTTMIQISIMNILTPL